MRRSRAMFMLSCLLLLPASLRAEEVIQVEKQNSGVSLLPSEKSEFLHVYRYRIGKRRMPPGLGTSDALPACAGPERRRKPVYYDTKELDEFDLTFYDYKDAQQKALAKKQATPTVPYLEGDLYNPHRDKENLQQEFARFFDVRCLPTRVRYVYVGDYRVEEYLEGSLAWGEQE